MFLFVCLVSTLTLLYSERPKLYTILAFLSAIELRQKNHVILMLLLSNNNSYSVYNAKQ